jgi:hypothetical protein
MSLRGPLDAEDLSPFDENASCTKCGSGRVRVIYHCVRVGGFPCEPERQWVPGEHLCRVCERCGGGWCEATVETRPARRPDLRVAGTGNGGQP